MAMPSQDPLITASSLVSKHTLEVMSLSCVRGERMLFSGLNFTLSPSQCLHIIGPNGCGKTSLLRIIAGLNTAASGDATWAGDTIKQNTVYAEHRDYVGHHDGLKSELTAYENLSFYQRLNKLNEPSRVDRDLAKMGLLECADLNANRLSFGQRRRLALARLLSAGRTLWILDEPFTGIDSAGRNLIEKICLEHLIGGGSILLTNHRSLAKSTLAPHLHELQLGDYSLMRNASQN